MKQFIKPIPPKSRTINNYDDLSLIISTVALTSSIFGLAFSIFAYYH
jgi:hypothetical protein